MAFCSHCGSELPADAKFCENCGAPVEAAPPADAQGSYEAPKMTFEEPRDEKPEFQGSLPKKVTFLESVKRFFTNYAEFHGRASRSEYWYFFLAEIVITAILAKISESLGGVWGLATLIPSLALSVRREHDIGRHWSRILIVLIPLVGWIIFICDMAKQSEGDNAWGPCAESCEKCGYYSDEEK